MMWDASSLLETLDESVCVLEPDGTIIYVNASGARITGLTREQLLGKSLWELYPDIDPRVRDAFDVVVSTGTSAALDSFYAPWNRWLRTQITQLGSSICLFTRDINCFAEAHCCIGRAPAEA